MPDRRSAAGRSHPSCPFDFDYLAKEYAESIYDVVAGHRACPAMHGTKYGGYWAITSYEDVISAAKDSDHYSSAAGVTLPLNGLPATSIPVATDPPAHGQYRRIVQPHFTAMRIKALEPRIREVIVAHVDAIAQNRRADLVQAVAAPVPPVVLGLSLGVGQERWADIRQATRAMLHATYTEDYSAQADAVRALSDVITDEIRLRRETPRDDVLSAIVNSTYDGRLLTDAELHGMVQLLFVAGHETTVHGIGNAVKHLLDNPAIRDKALRDTSYLDLVVEESLRFEAPIFGMARRHRGRESLHGQELGEGDWVLLAFAAANRDPDMFENPDTFNPDRPGLSHQVAFGHGRHRCLGEHLARAEIRIAVQELFTRLPGLRWSQDAEVTTIAGMARGPRSLKVRW